MLARTGMRINRIFGAAVPIAGFGGITSIEIRTTNSEPSCVRLELAIASTPWAPSQLVQGRSALAVLPLTLSLCTPVASENVGCDCAPAGIVTRTCRVAAPQLVTFELG